MSLTQTEYINPSRTLKVITAVWTAETSGSFTSAEITGTRGMFLLQVRTIPGGRAPSNNYDIDLTDADSVVVTSTLLDNRSATSTEDVLLTQVARPISSDLTLAITGNAVDRATGTIKLYLVDRPVAIVAAA